MRQGRAGPPSWAPGLSSSSLPWGLVGSTCPVCAHDVGAVCQHHLQTAGCTPHSCQVESGGQRRGVSSRVATPQPSYPPPGHGHSRGLALGVQLRGHQTLPDDEGGHPCGIIVLHSLQQPLITFAPVLALWGTPRGPWGWAATAPPPFPWQGLWALTTRPWALAWRLTLAAGFGMGQGPQGGQEPRSVGLSRSCGGRWSWWESETGSSKPVPPSICP